MGQHLCTGAALACTVPARRVWGPHFAEMPFFATREGYRREGNARRLVEVPSRIGLLAALAGTQEQAQLSWTLVQALGAELHAMGVQRLVLPSLQSRPPCWSKALPREHLQPCACPGLQDAQCQRTRPGMPAAHVCRHPDRLAGAPGLPALCQRRGCRSGGAHRDARGQGAPAEASTGAACGHQVSAPPPTGCSGCCTPGQQPQTCCTSA